MVETDFGKQNIIHRMEKLYHHWKEKTKDKWEGMCKYEQLDREIYSICLKSEKRCLSIKRGHSDWSPALVEAIATLSYWRARQRYKENNMVVSKLGREAGIPYLSMSSLEVTKKIVNSRLALEEIQRKSVQYRQNFLDARATKYARENSLSQSQAVQELLLHKSTRNTFALLRDKLKNKCSGPLSTVWVARDTDRNFVKDTKTRIIYNTKEEVHHQLLKRNRKHLRQAKQTPLVSGELASQFKWDGTGQLSHAILSGNVLNKGHLSKTIQAYFESLATAKSLVSTDNEVQAVLTSERPIIR